MIRSLPLLSCAVATLLLPVMAGAQTVETAKLDETLRESIAQGCVGTQSVIITVAPGYREGLRQTLSDHGDVVTGEFPAIDAIAATVHCADLTALASFGSIRAVSTNVGLASTPSRGSGRQGATKQPGSGSKAQCECSRASSRAAWPKTLREILLSRLVRRSTATSALPA